MMPLKPPLITRGLSSHVVISRGFLHDKLTNSRTLPPQSGKAVVPVLLLKPTPDSCIASSGASDVCDAWQTCRLGSKKSAGLMESDGDTSWVNKIYYILNINGNIVGYSER